MKLIVRQVKPSRHFLEVMQEAKVTVDGEVDEIPQPFIVMATTESYRYCGNANAPEAQLDRFMIKLSMGYPEFNAQIEILKNREKKIRLMS